MYPYSDNANMDVLVQYSNTFLQPKSSECDSIQSICPALQPIQMTVNVNQEEEKVNEDYHSYGEESDNYICFKCKESFQSKDIFAYQDNRNKSHVKPVCMRCSKLVDDLKRLKDWVDVGINEEKKYCTRCKATKPISRFANNKKSCNLCLVKNRISLMKSKYGNSYINEMKMKRKIDQTNPEIVLPNKIESEERRYTIQRVFAPTEEVKCCKCLKMFEKSQTFLYVETTYQEKEYICLECSLDVFNYYTLKDWEDDPDPAITKLCNRCKKYKSINRFSDGKSGCDYCSLKGRRLYLIEKRDNGGKKKKKRIEFVDASVNTENVDNSENKENIDNSNGVESVDKDENVDNV